MIHIIYFIKSENFELYSERGRINAFDFENFRGPEEHAPPTPTPNPPETWMKTYGKHIQILLMIVCCVYKRNLLSFAVIQWADIWIALINTCIYNMLDASIISMLLKLSQCISAFTRFNHISYIYNFWKLVKRSYIKE